MPSNNPVALDSYCGAREADGFKYRCKNKDIAGNATG